MEYTRRINHIDLVEFPATFTADIVSAKAFYQAIPGGQRFHFLDPASNELAVWSDL